MKIFIIGLPGSGKSYWAAQLGGATNIPIYDLDAEIEKHANKSITELFKQEGEASFRKLENEILLTKICDNNSFVLACGGGTPCFHNNMEIIKQHGRSVYLDCTVDFVLNNLKRQNEVAKRPLFQQAQPDLRKKMSDLLSDRKAFYEKADHIIPIDQLSTDEILHELKKITLS